MRKFSSAALAATFTLSMILGSAAGALADRDKGDRDNNGRGNPTSCVNPAGNTRGWCKHGDNDNDQGRGHRKHHRGGYTYMTGVVQSIDANGNATVRLSNGQIVTVRGAGLSVGQTITLRGYTNGNGQFVVNGNPYSAYGGPYNTTSISGTIISVSGNTIQLVHGLSIYTVNDSGAQINGNLYVGRGITVYGSWNGNVFNATRVG